MTRFLLLLLALALPSAVGAATPQPPKPLFAGDSVIAVTIEAPIARLLSDRSSDERIAGTLTDPHGNRLPVTVALRGLTRRTREICDFPPLHVRFTAPPPPTSLFAGQGKLKLVTHCRKSSSATNTVLLEHAAYRLFNRLSPTSLRTRLAIVDYRSPEGRSIAGGPAFFVEDLDDLARRSGLPRLRTGSRIPTGDLSPGHAALYGLFQHMVGNHDWSMRAGPVGKECCHNAEMLGTAGPGRAIPIPYDFDFSGLVSAPYAIPPESLGLDSVRDRKYRGYCVHNGAVSGAAATIRAAWPALLAELDSIPGLSDWARGNARSYLQGFYGDIASDSAVQSRLFARCSR